MPRTVPQGEWGFGFGKGSLKNFPELIPLVGLLAGVGVMGVSFIGYALYQKSDVVLNKTAHKEDSALWERVNPAQSQKLLTFNQKYEKIDELEQLKREIGSYKC